MHWHRGLFEIREWLNRRKALKEVEAFDLENFRRDLHNVDPLDAAKAFLKVGKKAEALRKWDEALARHPALVQSSRDSINVLLDLQKFDEAEAFASSGQEHFPSKPLYAEAYAMVAERRGDFAEAITRWQRAQKRFPGVWKSYEREAVCLRIMNRLDEAEAVISRAIRIFPDSVECQIEWARVAEQREDWALACQRWQKVTTKFSKAVGVLGTARSLEKMGRLNEGLQLLHDAHDKFPRDADLNAELAKHNRLKSLVRED